MPLNYALNTWLNNSGYEYHCFISYPRATAEIVDCAHKIKGAIESELGLLITSPKVFLDTPEIRGGHDWEKTLRCALCKSVAMVAVCSPVYYDPGHRWCGLEWAAMDGLSRQRLPNEVFGAIIPLIFRETSPLPSVSARVQYVDISGASLVGRGYYTRKEFREKIRGVVKQIEVVADALLRCQAGTDCEEFKFPTESAFGSYLPSVPPAPFRSPRA